MGFNIGGSTLSSSMLTPDGVILPKNFKRVTSDMVDTVYNQNCTITSQGNDSTGGYSISYYFNLGGCGNPDSGLYFTIKNTIPWSRVLCKFTNYIVFPKITLVYGIGQCTINPNITPTAHGWEER